MKEIASALNLSKFLNFYMSALESELNDFHTRYIPILHKHSPKYKKFDKNKTRNIHEMIFITGQNFVGNYFLF